MNHFAESPLREVPAASDAESAVLGALLLDNNSLDRVSDRLRAEHFFHERNRTIFTEISRQIQAGKLADPVTVGMALEGKVTMSELLELQQYLPSAANMRRFADAVIERSKSRALIGVSDEIVELAYDHERTIEDRVDAAQAQLAKLIDEAPRDDWVSAYEAMALHTEVLEQRAAGKITAIETGLTDLDDVLEGGLHAGDLVIIGARPSMGKTALGLSICTHVAERYGVGFLSMEMPHRDVNDRLVSMLGAVSLSAVKNPRKGEGLAWDRVSDGVDRARSLRFHTSDQGGLNLNQVRTKARNLRRLHGIDVLLVDYIGLMTGLDQKANRNAQLGEISRGLKNLAKELNICVICLAQLNRKAEERTDQMPQMSDLRDSGEIEQDADVILFIKRPIMANPELGPEWKHYAKLRVGKNRQGRAGLDLDLSYMGDQTRFSGWSGPAPSKRAETKHRGGGL